MNSFIENVYPVLLWISHYFFELDISRIIDDIVDLVQRWILEIYRFIIRAFDFWDLNKYIDTDQNDTTQHQHLLAEMRKISRKFSRVMYRFTKIISSYFVYLPLILELWLLFFHLSSIVRLWILHSFGITFLCIWAIVTDRRIVSQTICRVCALNVESFNLDNFLRLSAFFSICIGLLLFLSSIWTLHLTTCLVSLTVFNRIYRNVRSYLTIMHLDKL